MNVSSISGETIDQLVDQVMEELKCRWEKKRKTAPGSLRPSFKLLLLGNFSKKEQEALKESYEIVGKGAEEWELLLAAGLSVETMAYVAHGIAATPEAACILQGLLSGKQVFVLEQGLEYRKYKETAAKTIYLLYQNQERELHQMGIRFLQHSMDLLDLEKGLLREQNTGMNFPGKQKPEELPGPGYRQNRSEPEAGPGYRQKPEELPGSGYRRNPEETEADLRHCMLLQESELIRARGMGYRTILLNQKAKITPLALDYLKNHGLTIRRQ